MRGQRILFLRKSVSLAESKKELFILQKSIYNACAYQNGISSSLRELHYVEFSVCTQWWPHTVARHHCTQREKVKVIFTIILSTLKTSLQWKQSTVANPLQIIF